MKLDEGEIRKAIAVMKPDNELYEIRIVSGKSTASGYFQDADTMLNAMKKHNFDSIGNIYITLNGIKEDCYSREQRNKLLRNTKLITTSDNDIECYDWLLVDLDPRRPSGTSASDEQLAYAKEKCNEVYTYMRNSGFEEPIIAESGNGVHLLYNVCLKNDESNKKLIKDCLTVLDMFFSDDRVCIDVSNFNPARICKLYGTQAQKGAETPDRPHRISRIVRTPDPVKQNKKALLEKLAGNIPVPEKATRYNNYSPGQFDIEEWMDRYGIRYRSTAYGSGTKYILDHCPFDENHTKKDACIFKMSNGAIGFHCFHNSCADRSWSDVRLLFEPDAYDRQPSWDNHYPNYKNPNYQAQKIIPVAEIKTEEGQPVFYTTEQIRNLQTPPEEFIKTGITTLDTKIRGLKKGFVTCLSGLRACGKSSIISQLAIEATGQGYRTALFSGELTAKNLLKWLLLQAAGKNYVVPTQYEGYFVVRTPYDEYISRWMDGSVFVYNNYYGNDFTWIMKKIQECVNDHKVDLIILDNLMALNITMLEKDKYQQQSAFVQYLEDFAKKNNVHILFVAHPRKSQGFLRLDDVSGSNDIVNRVDNAFILHRVNEDFRRTSREMFKWKSDDPIYNSTNVIEICKDRDGGIQDVFIPLYFEMESKRLRNEPAEAKMYGWYIDDFIETQEKTPFD